MTLRQSNRQRYYLLVSARSCVWVDAFGGVEVGRAPALGTGAAQTRVASLLS
ncbi:hypothetical protein [Rhodoblastus sp.]|uniref:hypothetical protein n=1 Tax=Rhodoblastus sp. TaxID=1962975 RepID=UPI002635BC51|nr:hypothetical protein [Rhodoblastus sp.]